jgi:hypothetical protein
MKVVIDTNNPVDYLHGLSTRATDTGLAVRHVYSLGAHELARDAKYPRRSGKRSRDSDNVSDLVRKRPVRRH